jgi:hypothetical protein
MVRSMKENLKMINMKDLEYIKVLTVLHMKEAIKMIISMDMVSTKN